VLSRLQKQFAADLFGIVVLGLIQVLRSLHPVPFRIADRFATSRDLGRTGRTDLRRMHTTIATRANKP
jgi:hypothetical protein